MTNAQPAMTVTVSASPEPFRTERSFIRRAVLPTIGYIAILSPAIFFFLAVQHSALIFPFWDHCEFVGEFAKIRSHTLQLHDLWASHNHARPVLFRAIILINGLLTDWDISSEYVYLEASVILAFCLQALCLRRLCGAWSPRCFALVAVCSLFNFSPAGHNNHWWSFMLVLDLAHLFIIVALIAVCWGPRDWKLNLLSGVACWLATYTLTNGFVAFAAAAVTVHIARRPLLRFDRFSLFWLLNIVTIALLYFPGLAEKASGPHHLAALMGFCLAYLGSPVAALFSFPYRDMFDVPPVTLRNGIVGAILLLLALPVAWTLRKKLAANAPSALLFICFSVFALGSAALTALGRAEFDAVGLDNANASRYTIFAAYLVYALLFALTDIRVADLPHWLQSHRSQFALKVAAAVTLLLFCGFAARSYAKSIRVYKEAHQFNQQLASAYWGNDPANLKYAYPNPERIKMMVADLKRMRIGPYRFAHEEDNDPIELLSAGKTVDQFGSNGLKDVAGLGRVLFSNPASRFEMQLAPATKSLVFSFGIVDTAITATPNMAGAEFRVLVKQRDQEQLLWSRKLQPLNVAADRGVQSADLQINVAEPGSIVFETKAVGNPLGCWAYWRSVESHR